MGAADSHGPLPRGEADRNPYTQGYLDGFKQGRRHRDALGELAHWPHLQVPTEGGSVQHMPEPGSSSPLWDELEDAARDAADLRRAQAEVRTRSETGGEKGDKLARFDLIPAGPLWLLAELYGKGARKYDARNWERGYPWHLSYAAAMRHMTLFWQGEDVDPEMGLPHPVCAVFHMFALVEFMATQPGYDDRPTRATSEDARPRRPGRDDS